MLYDTPCMLHATRCKDMYIRIPAVADDILMKLIGNSCTVRRYLRDMGN